MSLAESLLLLIVVILSLATYFIHKEQVDLRKLLPYTADKTKRNKQTKILSVVAGEDLDMSEIEKSLYTTDLSYNLLSYKSVTQQSILNELDKAVTIFELSSHGLNGSFRIGNATLPVSWLSAALKNCADLECVLLLYCNSYLDLDQITPDDLFRVGLIGDVTDTTCILFARYFYFFVSKKYSYQRAFEQARLFLDPSESSRIICR